MKSMRTKTALALSLVTAVAAVGVAASAANASSGTKTAAFKAAWIYVGPHNDGGWSQAHDAGRLYVQKMLGSKVQTTFKENVPEGPQVTQVIEQLVRDGNKIIFATSFGYQDAMAAEAKKHPDVMFEQATGTTQSKNLAEYYGAGEDGIYLSGIAAGAASKKGVSATSCRSRSPRSSGTRTRSRSACRPHTPARRCRLVWTNSWFDPTKEKKAAESLISAGADVVGQNVDSPATGQAAQAETSRGSATTPTR